MLSVSTFPGGLTLCGAPVHDEAASKVLGGTSRQTWTHRNRNCTAPETAPETATETEPATATATETATETAPQLSRKRNVEMERAHLRSSNPRGQNHRVTTEERMIVDTVEPAAGGFLEVVLGSGWRALLATSEVIAVKPRAEGGCAIREKSGAAEQRSRWLAPGAPRSMTGRDR